MSASAGPHAPAGDPRDILELVARTLRDPSDPRSGLVHVERLPARRPRTVPVPDDLPSPLPSRLELLGVEALYTHQARCLELARAGRHTVVATGTASGKTLCYQLPLAETILTDDKATALYLAPTKALARDQLRALRSWRLPQLRAAAIDGDTPHGERDAIRRTANVVLTNPDLLHHSVLGAHARWADLLHRLRYLVIDECHAARGVFGAHVALVVRRLRRLCERYGADPTVILASATIGNPGEHAAALTGLDVEPVVEDGSERGPLEIGLWQPPLVDAEHGVRASPITEAGGLLAALVGAGVQTLVFTRSRRAAEVTALVARDRLASHGDHADGAALGDTIAAYRAGYLPEERRELEAALTEGRLRGLAATEALELGIDVGGLDAVVLAGWPGTAASFWQRLGRAGRGTDAAIGVLVAGDDPLDQYLVTHPRDVLARPPEDAIVDPTNPYVLGPHLRCACQEQPLTGEEAERWFGPTAPASLAADVDDGVLRERGGRYHWIGRRRASAAVNLRASGGHPFRIVDVDTGAVIGDVDEARAYRQTHTGAIYLHQGRTFEVVELDLEQRIAAVRDATGTDHTTRATTEIDVRVIATSEQRDLHGLRVGLGRVSVTEEVTGYDVLEPTSRRVLDHVELDLPPTRLTTVAVWWSLPGDALADVGVSPHRAPGALHAAEHAAIGLLPLIALCDRWDLGGLSTTDHPDTGTPSVFIYDGVPGGAGLAERSYRRIDEHLTATREAITSCACRDGCPSCVQSPKCGNGNEPLDKAGAVDVLGLVIRAVTG